MGWDASCLDLKVDKKPFKQASKEVKQKAGLVDGRLMFGGLDCSTCRRMLQQATDQNCTEGVEWSAKQVKQISAAAKWDFTFNAEDAWAYWSARKFLEVCAELGTGIYFY